MKITSKEAKKIGDSIGIDWDKVSLDQFTMGMNVELEHGRKDPQTNVTDDNKIKTAKIAWAHLKEKKDYYTKLKTMEKSSLILMPVNPINGESVSSTLMTDSLNKSVTESLTYDSAFRLEKNGKEIQDKITLCQNTLIEKANYIASCISEQSGYIKGLGGPDPDENYGIKAIPTLYGFMKYTPKSYSYDLKYKRALSEDKEASYGDDMNPEKVSEESRPYYEYSADMREEMGKMNSYVYNYYRCHEEIVKLNTIKNNMNPKSKYSLRVDQLVALGF
jgi:hypothetical protein